MAHAFELRRHPLDKRATAKKSRELRRYLESFFWKFPAKKSKVFRGQTLTRAGNHGVA